MAADDVQLPDLEVIQQFSLAVRSATAPRAEVVAALQADLAWLTGDGSRPEPPAAPAPSRPAKATRSAAAPPRKRTARRTGPPASEA